MSAGRRSPCVVSGSVCLRAARGASSGSMQRQAAINERVPFEVRPGHCFRSEQARRKIETILCDSWKPVLEARFPRCPASPTILMPHVSGEVPDAEKPWAFLIVAETGAGFLSASADEEALLVDIGGDRHVEKAHHHFVVGLIAPGTGLSGSGLWRCWRSCRTRLRLAVRLPP